MESTPAQALDYLRDNVPQWLRGLSIISQQAPRSQPLQANTPGSLATGDESEHTEIVHLENGDLRKVVVSPETSPARTRHGSQAKPASVDSSNGSAPSNKYRARNATVVDYDSSLQDRLENIVKGVAQARNLIRKAKMTPKSHILYDLEEGEDEEEAGESDDDDDDDESDYEAIRTQLRMRSKQMSDSNRGKEKDPKDDMVALGAADKRLEKVQDLCGAAAFQLLRDGYCIEADQASEELNEILTITKAADASFKADEIVAMLQRSEQVKSRMETVLSRTSEYREQRELAKDLPMPVRLTNLLNRSSGRLNRPEL